VGKILLEKERSEREKENERWRETEKL